MVRGDWDMALPTFQAMFGAACTEQDVDLRFEVDGQLVPVAEMGRAFRQSTANIARLVVKTSTPTCEGGRVHVTVPIPNSKRYRGVVDGRVQLGWRLERQAAAGSTPRLVVVLVTPPPSIDLRALMAGRRIHAGSQMLAAAAGGKEGGEVHTSDAKPLTASIMGVNGLTMPMPVFRSLFDAAGGRRRAKDNSLWSCNVEVHLQGDVPEALQGYTRITHVMVTVNRTWEGRLANVRVQGLSQEVRAALVGMKVVRWVRSESSPGILAIELAQ